MENKDATILQLKQENEELNRRIADLEKKLHLNSQNSSKPPLSDRYPKKNPLNSNPKQRKTDQVFLENGFLKKKLANLLNTILPTAMDAAAIIGYLRPK